MNKLGLAAASDSSVTISRGDNRRTYASAEKVFSLGPEHKVIVLHSGTTEFLQHPFEVLITEWKKTINRPLQKLDDYVDSLLNWISHRQDLFSEELQGEFLRKVATDYLIEIRQSIINNLNYDEVAASEWNSEEAFRIANETLENDVAWLDKIADLVGLNSNWSDARYNLYKDIFKEVIDWVFDDVPRNEISDQHYEAICRRLLYKSFGLDNHDARLVFAGYGEQDIYPVQTAVTLQGAVADRPRYVRESLSITPSFECALRTHGQDEAIQTFLRAYDQSFLRVATNNLKDYSALLEREVISRLIEEDDESTSKAVEEHLDQQIEKLRSAFSEKSENDWVTPFTSTLAGLPIASLAKMAESLIELQILRQSSQGVQDTVGGPVDVAVVTRERGVEWFRHKTVDDLWRSI
jgi:hypothetical protein